MGQKLLLVNLDGSGGSEPLLSPELLSSLGKIETLIANDHLAAARALEDESIVAMIVAVSEDRPNLHSVLRAFSANIGPLPDRQGLLAKRNTPEIINAAFESGIENIFDPITAASGISRFFASATQELGSAATNNISTEARITVLARAIRKAHQEGVMRAIKGLQSAAEHDYRAAFCLGRGYEARSEFETAQIWYAAAAKLKPWFRPARFAQAEILLVGGKLDLAMELLHQLEREYSRDVDRKSALASVYLEKNDYEKARSYALAAQALAPNHSRTLEALALIHIGTKEFPEAFALIDRMTEVGPYFAAKMNEVGIHLSQSGDFKTAILLYEKAHKVVRAELRFKISMNSALALRKMNEFERALRMVDRCEQEYGGVFPKLEKLRGVLLDEQSRFKGVA